MGGRGSSSSGASNPKINKLHNVDNIKNALSKNGIRLVGSKYITKEGEAVVSEIVSVMQQFQSKHGKAINTVLIGGNGKSVSFKADFKAKLKTGGTYNLGNTIIIPSDFASKGKSALKVKTKKVTITKNVKKQISEAYGRALFSKMKTTNPKLYDEFNSRIKNYVSRPSAKTKVSKGRTYSSASDYVADSVYHLTHNKKSTGGQDMIDLVREYVTKMPNVDFSRYGMKTRQTVTIRKRRR